MLTTKYKHYINRIKNIVKHIIVRFPYLYYRYTILQTNIKSKYQVIDYSLDNVLITPIGGGYGHIFEGLLIRKLILNKKNVFVLIYDGSLDYCDIINNHVKLRRLRCFICKIRQVIFKKAFHANYYTFNSIITRSDKQTINNLVDNHFKDSKNKKYDKQLIDKILFSSLQRYFLKSNPLITFNKIIRGYLYNIYMIFIILDKLNKKITIKYVITSHGTYSIWGSILEYCKNNGVFVVTHGQNYNNYGMEFTYNDSYLTGDLNDRENK